MPGADRDAKRATRRRRPRAGSIANQLADGTFRYQIDSAGNDLGGYSSVRHAGATLALYQVATATNDDRALAAGDRATAWMLDNLATNAGRRRAHRSRRHRAVGREPR